ncbi:MAG: DUF2007 domain-containing protein [Gammaproteobacteria bacterium]
MKKVITHDSLAYVGLLKNVLEQSGITCLIRNDQLSGGLGEIPFLECLPELWVLEDKDLARAATLLKNLEEPSETTAQWRCADCGELNDGQFGACWHCGTADTHGG